jgi:RNA 3'-phosphate cyclase
MMTGKRRTIEIDGNLGEGGGQIVRTALCLAALTSRPFRIHNLRARRSRPGLQPQHLAAVQAAAAICSASVEGASLGSQSLHFEPRAVRAGEYRFDIGTAGCAPLVLQTLYLPLAFAGGGSSVTVTGGTHVPMSPSFHYLNLVWQPYLSEMGLDLTLTLARAGFYPPGGGETRASIQPARTLRGLQRLVRGDLRAIEGVSAVARLPVTVAERQRDQALQRLAGLAPELEIRLELLDAPSPGTTLGLVARFEGGRAGFFALGARGKRAEQVADEAVDALLEHLASGAVVDSHAADQLLLPLALAHAESALSVAKVTPHLLTQREIVQAFLPVVIEIEGDAGRPGRLFVRPTARRPGHAIRSGAPPWNVVVTVHEHGYQVAHRALGKLGRLGHSDFHNVLVLGVDHRLSFLDRLRAMLDADPELAQAISHVVPADHSFTFQSPAEFEAKAREAVRQFAPCLAGKRFHVRMNRRGFKERISARHEEHLLSSELLRQLQESGSSAAVDFDDPDAVVVVETVGQHALIALCGREEHTRYPFIKLQ